MEDLKKVRMTALLDMLAAYTNKLTKMIREGYIKQEYENCKDIINRITTEIKSRKKNGKAGLDT